jgi:hypothetical protein
MNKHFPGVCTEHLKMTWPQVVARADVIFSPGYGEDMSASNQGFVAIDANAKGREAVQAIFPSASLKWDARGLASIEPAFGPRWMACAPSVPLYAAKFPNTLPEHLVKLGALDLKSDRQLCFLMAIAARQYGARAAWIEYDAKFQTITGIKFLADIDKDATIANLDFERLKRNPRTVPLSSNYAAKQVRSILAGRNVHLFELSAGVIAEIARMPMEERLAELEGLHEFDLLHLPFGDKEPIALRFNLGALLGPLGVPVENLRALSRQTVTAVVSGPVELLDGRDKPNRMVMALPSNMEPEVFVEHSGGLDVADLDNQTDGGTNLFGSTSEAMTILLLAMNDKNIVKRDRFKNAKKKSLRGLTAGPQGLVYLSRTVLEVPEDLPLEPGTHASPRAHRRRGHKRRVAYGVGRTERRWQWFPAVWVNGDPPEDWRPTVYEVAK